MKGFCPGSEKREEEAGGRVDRGRLREEEGWRCGVERGEARREGFINIQEEL